MIHYDDYIDKCFTLNSSAEPESFIGSVFDYGRRQRRALRGYAVYGVRLVLEYFEVMAFKRMWEDLNYGTDKFYSNAPIHADITTKKTIRFTKPYTLKELGKMKYELLCEVELVKTGDEIGCPLVPNEWLVPSETLVPC